MFLDDFIEKQFKERYKSFVIFGPALCGKTKFIKQNLDTLEADYIDLLAIIKNNQILKENIDTFDTEEFKKIIADTTFKNKVVFVDNFDFLINIWLENEIQSFLNYVEKNNSSICFIFILQSENFIKQSGLRNTFNDSRIINFYDIKGVKR